MSSTRELPQLLEPTNLLEPLDLKHQDAPFAGPSGRGESGERSARAQRPFTRETSRVPRSSEPARRSPMKSVVLAAGALACFGAGTLFTHVDILTPSDVGSPPTIASANHPLAPRAEVAAKSDESIQTEGKSARSDSNEVKLDGASNVTAMPPPTTTPAEQNGSATAQGAQSVPAQPAANEAVAPAVNDAVAGCTGSCKQQACPPDDANCLEGGAPSPAKALTNADGSAATPAAATLAKPARPTRQREAARAQSVDAEHADSRASSQAESERTATHASSREEERVQSSRRSNRAAQREAVDQPSGVKRKVATGGGASRRQNANRASVWHRDFASDDGTRPTNSGRWQSRDADQRSNGWGDWTANDASPARSSRRAANVDQGVNWQAERAGEGRWQDRDRDWDRTSSRRRERSDEYARDDDRRFRGGRDDFLMGRAERSEGSPMMLPPTRYRW